MARAPTIKNDYEFKPASRRELLKGLSLAGLAAGSATLAHPVEAAPAAPADDRSVTYTETAHVRTFYALSRK